MKTLLIPARAPAARVPCVSSFGATLLLATASLFGSVAMLSAQATFSDDFGDGNDSGWQRYDALAPVGKTATYSFPNGAYRIQTTYLGGSAQLTGRSGSIRPESYTDFYAAVDIVNWNDNLPQSFGLLARVSTPGLGSTAGYAFTWDRGNTNSQTSGDVDISRLDGEAPTGIVVTGSDAIRFQPGRSYRMVFLGKGANLEGRVYELPDIKTPIVVIQGPDLNVSPYLNGRCGLVVFDNSQGQNQTDATFDNFYTSDVEPPVLTLIDYDFGDYGVSWPATPQFVLQGSSSLPTWEDLNPTATVDGVNFYDFTPGLEAGQRFFRLVRK